MNLFSDILREAKQDLLSESIRIKDFDEFIALVSEKFSEAPDLEPEATRHWDVLYKESDAWLNRITSEAEIDLVDVERYEDFSQMKHDVTKNKRIAISKEYKNHPYWTDYQFRVVRVVHDYVAHAVANKPFGPIGEIKAYNVHCKLFSKAARPALFTEIVATNCVYKMRGSSPNPKCAIMHGFDFDNVGYMKEKLVLQSSSSEQQS